MTTAVANDPLRASGDPLTPDGLPWSGFGGLDSTTAVVPPRKGTAQSMSSDISEVSEASENGKPLFGGGVSGEAVTTAAALSAMTAAYSSSLDPSTGGAEVVLPDSMMLAARIVSTSNQLEEEPWLPVRNIVTMYRISVSAADKQWEVLRRYSDFSELHLRLSKSIDPSLLPPLPPKLMLNQDEAIAERYLELDVYLRRLLGGAEPDPPLSFLEPPGPAEATDLQSARRRPAVTSMKTRPAGDAPPSSPVKTRSQRPPRARPRARPRATSR